MGRRSIFFRRHFRGEALRGSQKPQDGFGPVDGSLEFWMGFEKHHEALRRSENI